MRKNLPGSGHIGFMQTIVSSLSPAHGSPPFAGGGFVQVRKRC